MLAGLGPLQWEVGALGPLSPGSPWAGTACGAPLRETTLVLSILSFAFRLLVSFISF